MALRNYQLEVLEKARRAYIDGFNAPCIVAPCGAGKSIIVAEMAKRATQKGNYVLFLVHRRELCEQIESTFRRWGVDMRLCMVGMVQTVCRRLSSLPSPSLIITDESHHSLASSYRKIYDYFPHVKRIGVTATPVRLGGDGLGDVNDILIESVSAKWLIENKFLAPFDYYSPSIADLTGLKTSRGEYVADDIEKRLDKSSIYGDVIKYYKDLSEGKQAICYCTSIKHSKTMAEKFNDAGIWAEHIDGETPKVIRSYVIDEFRRGNVQILCNVDLISEGFDVPDCNTSILLRPTQSLTLYIQQSMRCMRYKEGKRAVIIDHVGNYARFGLPDEDRSWTLKPKKSKKKDDEEPKIKVRQCPECFCTHEPAPVCPACGFVYPIKERNVEEKEEGTLEKITSFILDFRTPDDCESMAELAALGKARGYKPGWAYFQGKQRGFI